MSVEKRGAPCTQTKAICLHIQRIRCLDLNSELVRMMYGRGINADASIFDVGCWMLVMLKSGPAPDHRTFIYVLKVPHTYSHLNIKLMVLTRPRFLHQLCYTVTVVRSRSRLESVQSAADTSYYSKQGLTRHEFASQSFIVVGSFIFCCGLIFVKLLALLDAMFF